MNLIPSLCSANYRECCQALTSASGSLAATREYGRKGLNLKVEKNWRALLDTELRPSSRDNVSQQGDAHVSPGVDPACVQLIIGFFG
jgi:hypothetical protein